MQKTGESNCTWKHFCISFVYFLSCQGVEFLFKAYIIYILLSYLTECTTCKFHTSHDKCFFIYRLLQKARLKRNNAVVIRDSLRNEMSKRSKSEEENREKREQLVSTLIVENLKTRLEQKPY